MRAITYDPRFDRWQLRELPIPAFGQHDVLIRVHACGLNPVDANRGTPLVGHSPRRPGALEGAVLPPGSPPQLPCGAACSAARSRSLR